MEPVFTEFEKILGITFQNKDLLYEALSHSSYANEKKKVRRSNERLEFLGDSVLSVVVSKYLFENLDMQYAGMECGVRESRTIIGETVVNEADFLAGKLYPDAVCYGFYPVDLHDDRAGIIKTLLPEGVVPTVPRGALIPQGSSGLLAAGRIISSDRMANSGLRIQATCMATGQAAGAIAALCCRHGVSAQNLDNSLLRTELISAGAIVPPEVKE